MLKVHVQSEQVRRNIDLFQQMIRQYKSSLEEEHSKAYTTYVNRLTGAMRFSDRMGVEQKEWKPVILRIDLDQHEVVVSEGKNRAFECGDLEPTAYRIMAETFHVIEEIAKEVHDLREFSEIELEPPMAPVYSRDLVHEAWHQVDRIGAEELLKEHSTGSYLFRKDSYAHVLEHELTVALKTPVKCLTLSYLGEGSQVHDTTIVTFNNRWLIYNDDPNLSSEKSFSSIGELLGSLSEKLTKPLLHSVLR
jgi:hypothetical protein